MSAAAKGALASAALFAALVVVALLIEAPSITGGNVTAWLLAAAVPSLVITVVSRIYTIMRVRRRGTHAQSLRVASVILVLYGFAFGLLFLGSIQWLGLQSWLDPAMIVMTTTTSIAIGGLALVAFENSWIAERERRIRLLEEAVAVTSLREDMADINERLRVALNSDIDEALKPARVSIEERLVEQERAMSEDEWDAIAAELRVAARETVQPLSRRLWASTAARMQPIRIGWVLRNIVTKQPFQPFVLSLLLLIGLPDNITTYGWAVGLALTAAAVVTIYVVLGGANAVMRRSPQHHSAIFIGAVVLAMGFGLANFPLREAVGVRYTWIEFGVGAVLGIVAILLTSSIGSIRTHRDDVARTFQADIDRELVQSIAASRQSAQLARESARILHGSVQTRLIACAIVIEQAAEIGDLDAFQSALREAREVLRAPARGDERSETTLAEEVQRKVGLWAGLCSIDVVIAPDVETMSGRLARDAGRVVEEGLSNAIRHGLAKEIVVQVGLVGVGVEDGVVVVVDNNGTGLSNGHRGLGSSMLDSVSSSWELSALDPGSRLRVVL